MKVAITRFGLPRSDAVPSQDHFAAKLWPQGLIAVLADGLGDAAEGGEAAARAVHSLVMNFQSRPRTWTADAVTRRVDPPERPAEEDQPRRHSRGYGSGSRCV